MLAMILHNAISESPIGTVGVGSVYPTLDDIITKLDKEECSQLRVICDIIQQCKREQLLIR
jgi:hypothetical protein